MHLVRFRDPAGTVRQGTATDDTVAFGDQQYARDSVDILPPCEPTKIVCVGRNYADHAAERDWTCRIARCCSSNRRTPSPPRSRR